MTAPAGWRQWWFQFSSRLLPIRVVVALPFSITIKKCPTDFISPVRLEKMPPYLRRAFETGIEYSSSSAANEN